VGSDAWEQTNGVAGVWRGCWGHLGGRNHAEMKDLPTEKKIRRSTLESLAGREKMRREGPTGGSGRRPCGTMCGVAAEGDPMAGT
jgi:hypothetical protein